MSLQLHIWAPAFGLPSIDPECIAAAALLQRVFTGSDTAWELIPSYDVSIGQFPLFVDGTARVAGYTSILKRLQSQHSAAINECLSAAEPATEIALRSFLTSNALPLIDLSLYCTYQNYYNLTRPAYTTFLLWHTNYAYPPQRREEARARTSHLGLASLDVETLYDDMDKCAQSGTSISGQFEATKKAAEQGRTKGPSLLPLGKRSLRGVLGDSEHSDRFKLQQVANRCFEPLDAMLGGKKWLLDEETPSSADLLAFGYLSLMLYPPSPQRWLEQALRRWPRLVSYTERLREQLLGAEEIDAKAVLQGRRSAQFPWRLPHSPSVTSTAATIGREALQAIPVPQSLAYLDSGAPATSTAGVLTRLFTFSSLAFSILLGVGYHFSTQAVPTWDYDFRASDFPDNGDESSFVRRDTGGMNASDVLAELHQALNPTGPLDASQERERERLGGAAVGEVEVDIDIK